MFKPSTLFLGALLVAAVPSAPVLAQDSTQSEMLQTHNESVDLTLRNHAGDKYQMTAWTSLCPHGTHAEYKHHSWSREQKEGHWVDLAPDQKELFHFKFEYDDKKKSGVVGLVLRRAANPNQFLVFAYNHEDGGWYLFARADALKNLRVNALEYDPGSKELTIGEGGLFQ